MFSPALRLTRFLPLVLLVAFATPPARADDPAAAAPLTIEACIARAMQKNFALKIQSYTTANAVESLVVSQADYDPAFKLTSSKAVNKADGAATQLVGTRSDTFNTTIGVSQKIVTGATVSVNSNLTRSASNNPYTILNPAFASDLSLTISQPLLKNAGPTVNRAAIERARLGIDIANLQYKTQVLQVVNSTEGAYFDLVFAREQLRVYQLSLALAQKLLDENQTRKITGVATDLDVLQAQVGVATARNNVVLAQQTVRNAQDNLLNLIGQGEFNQTIGEVTLPPLSYFKPDLAASYQAARDNQPTILATEQNIKQLDLDVATAKRNRLPDLSLGGTVGYNALDRTAADSIDRLPNGTGYSWEFDLSLTVPWGSRADKSRYRTALNNLQQMQWTLYQAEQDITVQVRSAVRSVETNQESVTIAAQATGLSEKQYDLELARFDTGLSTSRLVLQAQDDLEKARVSELQARVNLRKAISGLHQLEGSSLDLYHISITDRMAAAN
ncbi:MAG: TolC family protein [Opitutales bacterium]